MHLYGLIVFVHVAAAVVLLSGSVVASPGLRAAMRRAGTTQELRAYVALGGPLQVLEPASALVVLASGIYLTAAAGFWDQAWVQIAVVFWLVNAIVAGAVAKPAISRIVAAAAAAPDGSVAPELDALRRSARWSLGGDAIMANDAAMLYVMTMKPGLAGSLGAVVVAALVVAAGRIMRRSAE